MGIVSVYAASGHRPDKLGGFGAHQQARLVRVAREFLAAHQPTQCISGMALGWDTAWALAALELGIPLIAALPFAEQASRWPAASQIEHAEILTRAADIVVVSDAPKAGDVSRAMQRRNVWMVDHADVIAAMFNGRPGGTYNCLWYANACNKPIINLYDDWRKTK